MPGVDASRHLISCLSIPDRAELGGEPYWVILHRVRTAAYVR